MNAKRKGTRNEWRSRKILESAGYHVVRSGASLGDWDLIAVGIKDVVLCQVKSNTWPGRMEMRVLEDFAVGSFTRKVIHRWRDRQRWPDIQELA
jgi:Holliday junction resolvase